MQLWLPERQSERQRREKDTDGNNETDGDTFLEQNWGLGYIENGGEES